MHCRGVRNLITHVAEVEGAVEAGVEALCSVL